MGILNCTPDSFFSKSRALTPEKALAKALALVEDGADILDIGAESTRPPQVYNPKSPPHTFQVSEKEELERLKPVLEAIDNKIHTPWSIDTTKPKIARFAMEKGASMINDILGFTNPAMQEIAAEFGTSIVVNHCQGTPETMQENPCYPNGVVSEILQFFSRKVEDLIKIGVKEEQITLDPGIGFGKTVAHNIEILQNVHQFAVLGFPLVFGTSRKMFLSKMTDKPTENLLAATLGTDAYLIQKGVTVLRVHDVAEHNDMRVVLSTLSG